MDGAAAGLDEQTLLLHIGMPKTGTSSIQAALAGTREALAQGGADGILYPVAGTVPTKLAHHVLGWEISGWRPGAPTPAADAVFAELAASPARRAILSTEHFPLCPPQRVREHVVDRLPAGWKAQVLCYARSPATAVLSLTDQRVTRQWDSPPLEAVLRDSATDFFLRDMLDGWDTAFPGQVVVRAFSRAHLRDGDAVSDFFCHWIGETHPATAIAREMPHANVGRPGAMVLLIDRTRPLVRKALSDIPEACERNQSRLTRFIWEALEPAAEGSTARLRWSRELLETCYDASIEGLRVLDDRWFGAPLLAAELEAVMAEVPRDATLLTAEEALGLNRAQVDRICKTAAGRVAKRFRRVLDRMNG